MHLLFMLRQVPPAERVRRPEIHLLSVVRRKDKTMAAKMNQTSGSASVSTPSGISEDMTLNELISRLGVEGRPPKSPTSRTLRESGVVLFQSGTCTVYSNGFAVYSNESGKTVVFLGDCRSYTYYFDRLTEGEKAYQKQSDTVDSFGDLPWILAVTVRGDHQIEMNSQNASGRYAARTDTSAADSIEDSECGYRGAYRFPNPEEEYIRKESEKERLEHMTKRQREIFILAHVYGYSQTEIALLLGTSQPNVAFHLRAGNAKFGKRG